MKNLKKLPTKQLEKFSTIFTQLGLVLVLFIVYLTLEYKTEIKSVAVLEPEPTDVVSVAFDEPFEFVREPKPKQQVQTPPSTLFIPDEEIEKVDNNVTETVINLPEDEVLVEIDIDAVVIVDEPKGPEPPETLPFILIENAPVFKGCEGLSKEENKKCFDTKMMKFVQRNFDLGLANTLGLNSGKYRISTQFIINDKGDVVDIQVRAPHSKLKKETQELIEKLPKFTPGKQRNKAVKVKYALPIVFRVD